jgi:hypothetical protein
MERKFAYLNLIGFGFEAFWLVLLFPNKNKKAFPLNFTSHQNS